MPLHLSFQTCITPDEPALRARPASRLDPRISSRLAHLPNTVPEVKIPPSCVPMPMDRKKWSTRMSSTRGTG
ncbi:hypothetical protein Hypma_007234 [Hypsizygus marmoreus]|uniref:Uncharacterized protein n=1 Tax=Hypsizygus marmoreus TaxID=39966 RepID=A0A369KFK4_HYPMA|nr:hypothetical protein Hypma_007234 [Hypsizygus marmoreus]